MRFCLFSFLVINLPLVRAGKEATITNTSFVMDVKSETNENLLLAVDPRCDTVKRVGYVKFP